MESRSEVSVTFDHMMSTFRMKTCRFPHWCRRNPVLPCPAQEPQCPRDASVLSMWWEKVQQSPVLGTAWLMLTLHQYEDAAEPINLGAVPG